MIYKILYILEETYSYVDCHGPLESGPQVVMLSNNKISIIQKQITYHLPTYVDSTTKLHDKKDENPIVTTIKQHSFLYRFLSKIPVLTIQNNRLKQKLNYRKTGIFILKWVQKISSLFGFNFDGLAAATECATSFNILLFKLKNRTNLCYMTLVIASLYTYIYRLIVHDGYISCDYYNTGKRINATNNPRVVDRKIRSHLNLRNTVSL
ncbi:hypothetical protein AGLY_008198 [Aphis glycines]|uniref:Uncharacterized protein n=1 Tax=Aphis glycines TaxID=307491 RepID=A0A6G0TNE5_APHGL|nr:hypothetical protein AGLY_008198 [Aphis glycines]